MGFSIRREETAEGGAYRIFAEDGAAAGQMTYSRAADGAMVIEHTAVEEAFGGRGAPLSLDGRRERAGGKAEDRARLLLCEAVFREERGGCRRCREARGLTYAPL